MPRMTQWQKDQTLGVCSNCGQFHARRNVWTCDECDFQTCENDYTKIRIGHPSTQQCGCGGMLHVSDVRWRLKREEEWSRDQW